MVFGIDEQRKSIDELTARRGEVDAKLRSLREWLGWRSLAAAVLSGADAVAWATAGLTSAVERGAAVGPLRLVVTSDTAAIVTTNVERPRLEAEAGLEALGFALHDAPWFEAESLDLLAAELADAPPEQVASDRAAFGVDCTDDLVALRLALAEPERERLAQLASDAAVALEHGLRGWSPGEVDRDVQGRIDDRLEQTGAFSACLIVGGDARVERFRHPLACGAAMRELVMAVVVAERGGLNAAATRFASNGKLPTPVRRARAAAFAVETAMLEASTPGAYYGDVLVAGARAYEDAGHPSAWRDHYQGGPVGYRQREFEIVPTDTGSRWFQTPLALGHAVAWNPSVAGGGKCEDTYLVEHGALRRLTETGAWPIEDGRPAVLDIGSGEAA
jgi:Xaa-Pro aminopeptidase